VSEKSSRSFLFSVANLCVDIKKGKGTKWDPQLNFTYRWSHRREGLIRPGRRWG
jgi:hypothetical protein